MTDQDILMDAPEGWTHVAIVEERAHYCKLSDGIMRDNFVGVKGMWTQFQGFEDVSHFRAREDIEQLAKANERVDGLEKALANCADALYESNINHKKAIDKIQAECIDVLFDFAAKRDDSGFAIALYEQPYEIQDAIRTFKQLSKDQSNG